MAEAPDLFRRLTGAGLMSLSLPAALAEDNLSETILASREQDKIVLDEILRDALK